jgi:hypothetical protein
MNKVHPPEPTFDQCRYGYSFVWDGIPCLAIVYPQMGGYVGKAVACMTGPQSPCWDVYVWHDGEFPFEGRMPVMLHHCEADQFILFANKLNAFAERHQEEVR